jgi:hypothetical protein
MNSNLLGELQAAEEQLTTRYKALRDATTALKKAIKLASQEKADALPMQKALIKLQEAAELVEPSHESFHRAVKLFEAETQQALDALAFDFARDVKESLEQRGEKVKGRPPTLVVGLLVLQLDMKTRQAQWFYGNSALTRHLPLTLKSILKAYEQQHKAIVQRQIDVPAFLKEVYDAWQELLAQRARRPVGGRISLIDSYSKVVMNRQSSRFWKAPSRRTFKEYERVHFVRDIVLAQNAPFVTLNDKRYRIRLCIATKSQANNSSRSIFIPDGALTGQYYADITFEEV